MYCSDYHLHTLISSDSPASLEQQVLSGLNAGLHELCVTDHWNLLDQLANPLPHTRDWSASIAQLRNARQQFGDQLEIRLGVEVGNGEIDPEPVMAEIVAVGSGGNVDGKEVTMQVSVGQKVIYSKYAGTEIKLDGQEYIILRQGDLLAVVEG